MQKSLSHSGLAFFSISLVDALRGAITAAILSPHREPLLLAQAKLAETKHE